jgi:hypothetical protein
MPFYHSRLYVCGCRNWDSGEGRESKNLKKRTTTWIE